MQERRRANRMNIEVSIKLNSVKNGDFDKTNVKKDEFTVEVVNLSKTGLAFKSKEKLELNTYYDTTIVLWTKETFETIIEVVRTEECGGGDNLYGCRFIGIMPSDELKIQIYEMINENNNE